MPCLLRSLIPLATMLAAPLFCLAQSGRDAPARAEQLVARAARTTEKITIDGRPDEPAWQTAELIRGLTQKEPEEDRPSSEDTEFRILYDQEYLYIAAWCHDKNRAGVTLNNLKRDFDIQEQDYVGIMLDTFGDNRNGYFFAATVRGNQRDLQFSDEGRNANINWDGVWFSHGEETEDGWTIEMAIPFNTLRFPRLREQAWGLQVVRRIRSRNEVAFWAPIPRRYTAITGVALAGELRGVEDVQPGRNFYVKPYMLAGVNRFASRREDTRFDPDAGVDLKYGVTSGLSLDLTVNTDFSHVEADTQQVNLTRFPLFFEEKREFFLENSGIFQFGTLNSEEALLFHSRTIGLSGGQPIPIVGGARLSGRAGEFSLGLLNMQTRSHEGEPATNFSVLRLRRNVLGRSDVGAMWLNRQSALPHDRNRAFGADGNLVLRQNTVRFSGALAQTWTPGREGDSRLVKAEADYSVSLFRATGGIVDIGNNFNPRMGFVRRRDRRLLRNFLEYKPRFSPETRMGRFVRDIFFTNTTLHTLFGEGGTETKYMLSMVRVSFQDSSEAGGHYEQNFERLRQPFEVSRGVILPVRDYHFNEAKLFYYSDSNRPLSARVDWLWASFYSGDRTELTASVQFRPNYRLIANISLERNDIVLPEGAFKTNLAGLQVDYSFSSRMFLNSFIQYNSESDTLSSNIRFRIIHRPLSDIYVVYNESRDFEHSLRDRSITFKYTRLFSF